MIRTRFAPSPTGLLHVGGLRTALYNYIFAKQNNGEFILRVEDTDQSRKVDSADSKIIEQLNYFNIDFDEGPNKNEKFGPYYQSQRLQLYKKHYIDLIKNKKAYICIEDNGNLIPEFDVDLALEKIKTSKFVVKLLINSDKKISIYDELRGDVEFDLSLIDDPIIIKSDGFPTYHFANVIDDHYMKISHVIRGEEWLSSLPKHVLLYESFGWELPSFIHLPLLLNFDKSKLSKRQGDVHVENFIDKGYLKDAIINFIALLGWHPSGNKELFDLNYLLGAFSIDRLQKSGAIFDIKKLDWMNSQYIKKLSSKDILDILHNMNLVNKSINPTQYFDIIKYAKNNSTTLLDINDTLNVFLERNIDLSKKLLTDHQTSKLFELWQNQLSLLEEVTDNNIQNIVALSKKELNIYGKSLFIPLRLALISKEHGPDLFTIVSILGLEESKKRIKELL